MTHRLSPVLALGLLAILLAGCSTPSGTTTPAPTSEPPITASPTPTATAAPTTEPTVQPGSFTMPSSCEQVWSPDYFAVLQKDGGPLNDPNVQRLLPTSHTDLLDLLATLSPVTCTWGPPGSYGVATAVAAVSADQQAQVLDTLNASGFTCAATGEITRCEITGTQQFEGADTGEVHLIGAGGWVATSWLNTGYEPGYSDDIRATLWPGQ